jgi:ABC-type Fe3+ transport system substrate-binding protein
MVTFRFSLVKTSSGTFRENSELKGGEVAGTFGGSTAAEWAGQWLGLTNFTEVSVFQSWHENSMDLKRRLEMNSRFLTSRWVVFVVVIMTILPACGPATPVEQATAPPQAVEVTEAPAASNELVVYGWAGNWDLWFETWAEKFKEETGIQIKYISGSGTQMRQRIEAEANEPRADVFISTPADAFTLDRQGLLAPIPWDSLAPAKDIDDRFKFPTVAVWGYDLWEIGYNAQYVKAEEAPQSWADLTDPKWKGKLGLAEPSISSPVRHFMVLERAYGEQKAWDYELGMYDVGGKTWNTPGEAERALGVGEVYVAPLSMGSIMVASEQVGGDVKAVVPEEGGWLMINSISMVKDSPHPDAALKFLEWYLSPWAQDDIMNNLGISIAVNGAVSLTNEKLATVGLGGTPVDDILKTAYVPDWAYWTETPAGSDESRLAAFLTTLEKRLRGEEAPAATQPTAASTEVVVYGWAGNWDLWFETWAEKFKEETGIQIKYISGSGTQMRQRIEAEANEPRADVYIGAPGDAFALDNQGLLAPIPWDSIAPAKDIDERFKFPNVAIWGYDVWQLAYNGQFVDPADAPTKWSDLADPKWDGKVGLREPSLVQAVWHWMPMAEEYGEDKAWEYLVGAYKNAARTAGTPGDAERAIATGEVQVATMSMGNIMVASEQVGGDVEASLPEEGGFLMINSINMVKDSPHPDAALKFLEWYLSPWAQDDIMNNLGISIAVNNSVELTNDKIASVGLGGNALADVLENAYVPDWGYWAEVPAGSERSRLAELIVTLEEKLRE